MNYYLLDLERTIGSGTVFYWRQNRHGYTRDIQEAGLFPESTAAGIALADQDHRTIMVSEEVVKKIFSET